MKKMESSRYMTYQELKYLVENLVNNKCGLSLDQYKDILYSIEYSAIL